jgi:GNAT superfamily N-acetyltransferase
MYNVFPFLNVAEPHQMALFHEVEGYRLQVEAPVSITLPDGTQVMIRKAQTKDALLIQEMHDRLSPNSIRLRYNGVCKPGLEDLRCLCGLTSSAGVVIAATIVEPQEMVIALAQYQVDPQDKNAAEPGLLVEDLFQGQGLGKALLDCLAQYALQNGLDTFIALVHPTNLPVLQMLSRCGFAYKIRYNFEIGLREIRLFLEPEYRFPVPTLPCSQAHLPLTPS